MGEPTDPSSASRVAALSAGDPSGLSQDSAATQCYSQGAGRGLGTASCGTVARVSGAFAEHACPARALAPSAHSHAAETAMHAESVAFDACGTDSADRKIGERLNVPVPR